MAEKNANRFSTMPEILKEYEQLEKDMADPSMHLELVRKKFLWDLRS